MNIGDKVKALREKAGLTQEELAELMGVQRSNSETVHKTVF